MGKVDKAKALEMLNDGYMLKEVAEEFGVSRQWIAHLFPHCGQRRQRRVEYDQIAYPGIARWMRSNRMSVSRFAEMAGMKQPQLSTLLHGRHSPMKSSIDAILKATGLTYEEAFGVGEDG